MNIVDVEDIACSSGTIVNTPKVFVPEIPKMDGIECLELSSIDDNISNSIDSPISTESNNKVPPKVCVYCFVKQVIAL